MRSACWSMASFALAILAGLVVLAGPAAAEGAEHVLVVGVDGLRGDAVGQAETPNMHRLMAEGASTVTAEAVLPTVSAPNWATILMGSEPKTNGIASNDWKRGEGPLFPTIFRALHEQRKEAYIAVVYEWGDFGRLFDHEDVSLASNAEKAAGGKEPRPSAAQAVTSAAADAIRKDKPTLTFVHLDLVDHAGHGSGYGTPAYVEAVAEVDRYLGELLKAVSEAGIAEKTVVIVVGDHGGSGKGHGGTTQEEIRVPWIIAGPGIAPGKVLSEKVSLSQTAPTVARALKIEAPAEWTAKAVEEAFVK